MRYAVSDRTVARSIAQHCQLPLPQLLCSDRERDLHPDEPGDFAGAIQPFSLLADRHIHHCSVLGLADRY